VNPLDLFTKSGIHCTTIRNPQTGHHTSASTSPVNRTPVFLCLQPASVHHHTTTMALYEIERKFVFNPSLLTRFRSNHGSPPFHHLIHQRTESFQDEYYDSFGHLLSNGLYIRKRNNSWEAKHRQSGDFIQSSFYETSNLDEITKLINAHSKSKSNGGEYNQSDTTSPETNFGLTSICRYVTQRETFLADERFSIMLDTTDFGHWVGEVELQAHDSTVALAEIDKFMQKYAWFFANEATPKGKMTAYFELFGFPPGAH
jgi:thiamine-triphosphatase